MMDPFNSFDALYLSSTTICVTEENDLWFALLIWLKEHKHERKLFPFFI